jgi:hypothetical protein
MRTLSSITTSQKGKLSKEDATKEPPRFLGRIAAMSRSTSTSDLDWALIRLECTDIFSWINPSTILPLLQGIVDTLPRTKLIQVFTASNGAMNGKITGTPTFMQAPHSIAFQEMWTVQLDGPLGE